MNCSTPLLEFEMNSSVPYICFVFFALYFVKANKVLVKVTRPFAVSSFVNFVKIFTKKDMPLIKESKQVILSMNCQGINEILLLLQN